MITVHHLNDSRSQRVLWALEELGLPHEIRHHARDAVTRLAPPELKAIHPLGKSPVIEHEGQVVFESGAILDYLSRRCAGGRLAPPAASPEYDVYQQWMHYAEGSAMLPLMLDMYVRRWARPARPCTRASRARSPTTWASSTAPWRAATTSWASSAWPTSR